MAGHHCHYVELGALAGQAVQALIATAIGSTGRLAKVPVPEWVSLLKPYAKTLGEWTFYALILMLVITLARRAVPYKRWYWFHRFMPLAYLILVFHGIVLTPPGYWSGVGGWLLALTMASASSPP
jgi:predicted ferric reductase